MKFKRPNDIVLIIPPHRWRERRYSLGILYVSGFLRDAGYDNIIIEQKILGGRNYQYKDDEKAGGDIVEKVLELKPKILGFTASTIEIHQVIRMNQKIKENLSVFSIIGGPQVTAAPTDALANGFDAVVIAEGEQTVVELVKELEKENPDLSRIKGIAWKNKGGQIIINPPRELMDISQISLPAYDKIDMEHCVSMWDGIVRGVPLRAAVVMGSRGCPYVCSFCACNKVFGHKVRYRAIENIEKEIQYLKDNYQIEGVWFADDTLTVNYEYVKKICQLMKKSGLFWGAQSRVDLTNKSIVKLMKESGCLQLDFGVESGSQRILDEIINKKIKIEQVKEAFKLCHQYGIRTHASFMIGLPTETKEEMERTFEFAKKIKPDYYAFSFFMPLPGTPIYERFYKNEITLADYQNATFHRLNPKFNKSEVLDINKLFDLWRVKLFEGIKLRNLIHSLFFIKLFLILPHRQERFDLIWFKLKRFTKFILNKFGFKFSLAG